MTREPKTPADLARKAWVSDFAATLLATGLQRTSARIAARMIVNRFGTAQGRATLLAFIERMPVREDAAGLSVTQPATFAER